jgi:2,4-dienoyl-CoA reductase (NADPH2)
LGIEVHLFEAAKEIGGQFNMAKKIPGKEEFNETLRFFGKMIEKTDVVLHLNTRVSADFLIKEKFDQVVLATGVVPRTPKIEGIRHPKAVSYLEVLLHDAPVGKSVAIIGAGGIGFDVAMFLTDPEQFRNSELLMSGQIASAKPDDNTNIAHYRTEWGIDPQYHNRGGLTKPQQEKSPRKVFLLQRSEGKIGERLGKTTGWAHRLTLKNRNVQMLAGVEYLRIDDAGLHVHINGKTQVLEVETVVVCAGQEPLRDLQTPLEQAGIPVTLIGGAKEAGELDAKRAIAEGLAVATSN